MSVTQSCMEYEKVFDFIETKTMLNGSKYFEPTEYGKKMYKALY
jgi:hypothetical protein